ncbi:Thiol-disulfide isomerase or thioredoxin [Nannocystis exedens]|uniref:Thiol-disulfide isomerase or thioredoxin n=1 Tax=Nannocystis exedens TaxID=54 RepID=A0A1I2CCI1_9BACT|nr:TlpA disulfide reductase family protein [Nannocystis exedens]PCC68374.1 Thiol-disulfide oxidoreductase ResA [Nannocystis exedens]SFE66026.1 Thiol-disulfide isomerase or thioredoxin [Nannocystis exedens]
MRVDIVPWLFVLAACGAATEVPAHPAPSPVIATTKPVSDPAPAPAVATVGVRLRGHDGSPLQQAAFTLYRNGFMKPVASGPLAADGSFRADVEPGVYFLSVAAVDHAQLTQPLLVDGAVEVEGNLGTYARPEPGEALQLNLQWLDADRATLASDSRSAARTPAGTYRLDLADRPKRATTLRYQLGSRGRTYNGPLADRYESDGGGDYWSVVDLAGRDALELDLARLPPAGKAARLEWRGERPELRAVRTYREAWEPRVAALQRAMLRDDGNILAPDATETATMAALAAEAFAEADAAGSEDERVLLRLAHLDLFAAYDDHADARERADWVLAHVDPLDPRLGAFWNVNNLLYRVLDSADETFAARAEAWLAHAQDNPDIGTALGAIEFLVHRAHERGLDGRVAELYARAREPRFAGTYTLKRLEEQFDPDRKLQRGKPFPGFEFPALAAGAPPVAQADRRGRLYLIEFWATWCGPCVAEMPALHAAYAAVNGLQAPSGEDGLRKLGAVERPKLEFVFVSFDQSPAEVEKFRAQHWSMPWTHAFVGRDGDDEVMARYGFSGVPTGVLVDGAGTIVALGGDLRGEALLPTLQRALAAGSGDARQH